MRGYCNSTEIQHLQRLQNRAARIVTNSAYDAPIKRNLESLVWKTIQQLICIQTKANLFNSSSACTLCNSNTGVRLPRMTTTQRENFLSFMVLKYGIVYL